MTAQSFAATLIVTWAQLGPRDKVGSTGPTFPRSE
jgi:hypothetical protein